MHVGIIHFIEVIALTVAVYFDMYLLQTFQFLLWCVIALYHTLLCVAFLIHTVQCQLNELCTMSIMCVIHFATQRITIATFTWCTSTTTKYTHVRFVICALYSVILLITTSWCATMQVAKRSIHVNALSDTKGMNKLVSLHHTLRTYLVCF